VTVREALAGITRLGMDTPPFIYFVEENPDFADVCAGFFAAVDAGQIEVYTSMLTLTETLTKPLASRDVDLANVYNAMLTGLDTIHLLPITLGVAHTAAEMRANYGLKTPDAVQIAAAIEAGCEAFLTNDKTLSRVSPMIKVLYLSDIEADPPAVARAAPPTATP
jgi:predicted nucleic acid-binding protein